MNCSQARVFNVFHVLHVFHVFNVLIFFDFFLIFFNKTVRDSKNKIAKFKHFFV